jgi:hypothetical protein
MKHVKTTIETIHSKKDRWIKTNTKRIREILSDLVEPL